MHFTTAVKAWSYGCTHPFRDEWFASLDQTPYRGWRPSRGAYLAGEARRIGRRVKERLRRAARQASPGPWPGRAAPARPP